MSSGNALTDPALLAALESQRRLRVEDYHRMVAASVFDEDERLELLEGVIVQMSPRSPRHAVVITRLCDPQFAAVGPDCLVRAQLPLTLEPDSEPEPDVAIVRRGEGGDRHRQASVAGLAFLVADLLA
jgi:Uma2 family endonuclease